MNISSSDNRYENLEETLTELQYLIAEREKMQAFIEEFIVSVRGNLHMEPEEVIEAYSDDLDIVRSYSKDN